ncbi:helix-turn-helix transcriptional regulator [Streptomyces sp. NPDC051364]|uniref:helix-turn-helix transcriptional regulator n=1 Tax=Streptomyces sp. NPDC051364 TaxID=3155799 RepID=UPI003429864C
MDVLIGHPLAYARELRGWSQTDLVARMRKAAASRPEGLRTGADKTAVSRWENWRKTPSAESQLLIAEAFGVPLVDLDIYPWPHWLPGRADPLPLGSAFTVRALREAQRASMERRNFMVFSAVALSGLSAQWASLEPDRLTSSLDGRPVDAELVDWLETTAAALTSLPTERRQHTVKLMDAHLDTVTDLLEGGRYPQHLGLRLHALAARLASTCGWYRFDQGKHHAAGVYWNAALTNAHAADDRDAGAGVLADYAYQSIWVGRPHAAVDPLTHALARTSHPTARSLLRLRRARAYAAAGARAECYRDLTAAETAITTEASTPPPSWCSWMSPADLSVDAGQCLLDLGNAPEARARIDEGLALLPVSRDKTRGVFLLSQGRSFLKSGEIEQAAAVATQSLDLAERIGADRCVGLVRDMAPDFAPYRREASVGELLERLRSA